MNINGKKALIIGLAVSGIPTVQVLNNLGAKIKVNDKKSAEQLEDAVEQLKDIEVEMVLGDHPTQLADWPDFAVISPGVPMDIPLVQELKKKGKEVLSEIELAYRFSKAPIVAITGTNGKTTTTALTGEIFKRSGRKTFIVGNIGKPIISVALTADAEDILVAEISSFQLEGVKDFKPVASAILNLTPDHLDRHKTFENYINAKARIFEKQTEKDFVILNADDDETLKLAQKSRARVFYFSRKRLMGAGAFVERDFIIVKKGDFKERVCPVRFLKIPGDHNLEDALAAAALAWGMEVPAGIIGEALMAFEGVEHRLEYVDTINGVRYVNDSKGTNPDASIKAIQAMHTPTILIAGGYEKGSDFDELVDSFGDKIKGVVLLGETALKIKKTCQKRGYNNIYIVKDMEEAVNAATKMAEEGDCVLLSPACASWDMYRNFEERGRIFKQMVGALRRL